MHNRGVVVRDIEVVCVFLLKVLFLAVEDVFIVDLDVNVPVSSTLFVPEADCVNELMLNDAILNASVTER